MSVLALPVALSLLVLTVETAPHLVHHAFDADHGAECEVLQAALHTDGVSVAPPVVVPPPSAGAPLADLPAPPPRGVALRAPAGRAPPLAA